MDSIHKKFCSSVFIVLISCILCQSFTNTFADDKPKKTKLIHIYEREGSINYPWLYGKWQVSYEDKKLGRVTGIAHVTGSTLKGISVTLKHPHKASKEYYLESELVKLLPDDYKTELVEIIFSGQSPPSGSDSADQKDLYNSKRLTVPEKEELKINIETEPTNKGSKPLNAERISKVIDGRSLTVELYIGKSPQTLKGTWKYACSKRLVKYNRAGEYEESTGTSKGTETWTRIPIFIDSVTTSNTDGMPLVWALFEGKNLPVEPKRRLEIEFEDPNLAFTGRYKTDPKDASKLYAQVKVKPQLAGNKKKGKLNDVDFEWDLGIPQEPEDIRFIRRFYEDILYKVDELFLGEIFYFEAVYENPQLPGTVDYVIISKDDKPLKITLSKDQENLKVMRSGPILLGDKDSKPPSKKDLQPSGPEGVASKCDHFIRSAKGNKLTAASFHDLKEYRQKKVKGQNYSYQVASVNVNQNQSYWERALKIAKNCKEKNPELYTVSSRNLFDLFNRYKIDFKERKIEVEVKSHAAMLILRDELRIHVRNYYRSLFRRAGQDSAQWEKAWNEWQDYMIKCLDEGKPHVLFHFKVKRPPQVGGFRDEWALSQALSCQRYFKDDEESFKDYARQALAEAKRKLILSAGQSVQQVRDVGDCEIEELMRLVGFGIDPVVNAVLPRLVRPPRGHEPRIPSVVPDRVARSYVKNLSILAEAIRAQKHFSDLDTEFIMMAATVASAGLSSAGSAAARVALWAERTGRSARLIRGLKAASYLSGYASEAGFLAGDLYDLYQIKEAYDGRQKAMEDLAFGKGTAELFGMERWKQAEGELSEKEFTMALSTALVGGPRIYNLARSRGIFPDAASQLRVRDKIRNGVDPDDLSKAERMTYDYMIGEAENNVAKAKNSQGIISEEDLSLLDNYEVTVKARQMNPPPSQQPPSTMPRAPPDTREGAKQASNLVDDHSEVFSNVATAKDQILLTRPVNVDSPGLIANGASTKSMDIKAKSSDWGPQKGYIPVEQKYSKLRNEKDTALRTKNIEESNQLAQECIEKKHAIAVSLKKDGKSVKIVKEKSTGQERVVLCDDKGRFFDPDTGKSIPKTKFDGTGRDMKVLADPETKQPLTADYDLLAIGHNKDVDMGKVEFKEGMGYISPGQVETLETINKGVAEKGYTGGKVVHHGPENQYAKSKGVDYPITAYEPGGYIIHIPKGPEGNPDKYLKEYFFMAKKAGYELEPSPNWGWGKYNDETGWK